MHCVCFRSKGRSGRIDFDIGFILGEKEWVEEKEAFKVARVFAIIKFVAEYFEPHVHHQGFSLEIDSYVIADEDVQKCLKEASENYL